MVGGALVAAPAAAALPGTPASAARAPQREAAFARAKESGQRVEIESERVDDETIYANPDGTVTSEYTAGPVRAQDPDGGWHDLDSTLAPRADGMIGPKVSATGMAFSAGRAGQPLVRLVDGDKTLTVAFPGEAHPPAIDGDTATYGQVFPGVDLHIRAESDGYAASFEIKSAEAAASKQVADLTLPYRLDGLRLRENSDVVEAVGSDGTARFQGEAGGKLWDSNGDSLSSELTDDPSHTALARERIGGPLPGDQVGELKSTTSAGTAHLAINVAALADKSKKPKFPLFAAPPLPHQSARRTQWNMIADNHPGTAYSRKKEPQGLGRCVTTKLGESYYPCGNNEDFTAREYVRFAPPGAYKDRQQAAALWKKRDIKEVAFSVKETYSFSCGKEQVDLNAVSPEVITAGMTWDGIEKIRKDPKDQRNPVGSTIDSVTAAYGYSDKCPAANLEMGDKVGGVVTKSVTAALEAGRDVGLLLKAHSEGQNDGNGWKKILGNTAALSITYNTPPNPPTNLRMDGKIPCAQGADAPFVNPDRLTGGLALHATATDDDKGQKLTVTFNVNDLSTKKPLKVATTEPSASGADFVEVLGADSLVDGDRYSWTATPSDHVQGARATASKPCEFVVDKTPPALPTVTSAAYPEDKVGPAAGQKSVFHFRVASQDTTSFRYAINNDVPNRAVTQVRWDDEQKVTAADPEIAPTSFGPSVMYVVAVDKAGNPSPAGKLEFNPARPCPDVLQPSCAEGAYRFDASDAAKVADESGHDHALTLSNVTSAGGAGAELAFDGKSSFGAAGVNVLDSSSTFTAAAWVKPSAVDKDFTVLSEVGEHDAALSLGYVAKTKAWALTHAQSDGLPTAQKPDPAPIVLTSTNQLPVAAGKWTFVAVVYDGVSQQTSLYVDGARVASARLTEMWAATAGLQIGRQKVNGVWSGYFPGSLGAMRLYRGALTYSDLDTLRTTSQPS